MSIPERSIWPTKKLGEIAKINPETWDPKKESGQRTMIGYIDIANVDGHWGRIAGHREITPADAPTRARRIIRDRDVIFSTVRPNLMAIAVVPTGYDGTICSTGFAVLRARSEAIPEFLCYLLRSPQMGSTYSQFVSGAHYPALNLSQVRDLEVLLPPLSTQRKIVEILDQADALRSKRKEANEKMKQLAPAIFIKMFGDPATNPMGWEVKRLGDLLQLNDSGIWGERPTGEEDIGVLRSTNITERGEWNFDDVARRHIPEQQRNKYLLKEGDILITKSSGSPKHIGKMALVDEAVADRRAVFANFMQRLRLNREALDPVFLYHHLNHPIIRAKLLRASATTSGLKNLKPSAIDALPVLVPPVSSQRKFSETVGGIKRHHQAQARTRQKLDDLFDSLIHRAFSGELTA